MLIVDLKVSNTSALSGYGSTCRRRLITVLIACANEHICPRERHHKTISPSSRRRCDAAGRGVVHDLSSKSNNSYLLR